jgi:hypothetical protein
MKLRRQTQWIYGRHPLRKWKHSGPTNPSAMDVMLSRISTGQSLKKITAAIMREDGLEIDVAPDNGNTTDWLLEGLRIEDEQ